MNSAGIDVGSKQLHVALNLNGKPVKSSVFNNDFSGIEAIRKLLKKNRVTAAVLEATGVYHMDLALALAQDPATSVMVLNPKAAHNYAKVCLTRTKTDKIDAALLSDYAQRMPFVPWQAPDETILALRACSRRLAALTEQRTQSKNQRHALAHSPSTPAFILEDVQLSIDQVEQQIATLERRTLALIEQTPTLSQYFELLHSIKGVGDKSAIQLLAELLILPKDMNAKQWVAMAGLDPKHHQSGSSVDKKARISKAGNRYLRKALYMPALSATRHVPQIKAYYEHLIKARGLKKIQAICAVMRKLLHAIHGMWRVQKPFDPTRFYAAAETTP